MFASITALAGAAVIAQSSAPASPEPSALRPAPPRFELRQPLPSLPGIYMDRRLDGIMESDILARSRQLQGRMLWVDATANLDRYNSEEKIIALVRQIADSGFNTVTFDVKPISGHVVYLSKLAPKLSEWRGRSMDPAFDPLPVFSRECRKVGISFLVSLNAFSEGHSLMKTGPGYAWLDRQTIVFEPKTALVLGESSFDVLWEPGSMPNENELAIHLSTQTLPTNLSSGFALVVQPDGVILDGFEIEGPPKFALTRGQTAILGVGASADFLRLHAVPGAQIQYRVTSQFRPISAQASPQIPLMMNPYHPKVIQYNLDILTELVQKDLVDGVLYDDRFRYAGSFADFSPEARSEFEAWLGHKVAWPEDIFTYNVTPQFERGILVGPQYENWLIFRAHWMNQYIDKVRTTIQAASPTKSTQFGIYAGSWYGEYPSYGVNYAAPNIEPGFWFASPDYGRTGIATKLDLLVTGCYYRTASMWDALRRGQGLGATIESAARLSTRVANDETWVYAGISLSDFKDNKLGLMDALQAAVGASQGVMVFDLSHNIEPMWPVFKQAFSTPMKPPHADGANLVELRRRAKLAKPKPPIIISNGLPGAGH